MIPDENTFFYISSDRAECLACGANSPWDVQTCQECGCLLPLRAKRRIEESADCSPSLSGFYGELEKFAHGVVFGRQRKDQ
jgi:ribosomal protein L40E